MSDDRQARGVRIPVQSSAPWRGSQLVYRLQQALATAVWLAFGPAPAVADPVCDPSKTCCANPGGGSTCGGGGATTQGNTSGTQQGVGNPINVVTGNKYQQEVDLPALPGVLGLEVVRHYNSATGGLASATGILGRGWKLGYDTELTIKTASTLEVLQADGSTIVFTLDKPAGAIAASSWSSADPAQGRITSRPTAQGKEYRWRWSGAGDSSSAGRELLFDERGKLAQISAPTGEFVSLQRDAQGWLFKVTDPQGRSLHLNYLDRNLARSDRDHNQRFRGLQSIDTPLGRIVYTYNDRGAQTPEPVRAELAARRVDGAQLLANLVKVSLPTHYEAGQKVHAYANRGVSSSSVARLYHYEDLVNPTLLTGISVTGEGSDGRQMLQRIATYGYDAYGRANLSVKGEPARLATDARNIPLEPKRLAAGTGIEQVTLSWPRAGEVALTNALGLTTRYQTAKIAGQPRIVQVRGPGCVSCGPSNVRYGYDGAGRLVEETYLTSQGQPVGTRRSQLDAQGRTVSIGHITYIDGNAQPVQWLQRFEYTAQQRQPTQVSSSSVIEGKEHTLRIEHNEFGQPTSVTEGGFSPLDAEGTPMPTPISRTTRYRYETINGRSVLVEIDGPLANGPNRTPADSDITRAKWDRSGSLINAFTEPGGSTSTLSYESSTGELSRVTNGEGFWTQFKLDARGQLVTVASGGPGWAQPREQSFKYDALGRMTELGAGSEASKSYRPQVRQAFDVLGRLQWRANAVGFAQQLRYDGESRIVQTARYGGDVAQTQHFAYDARGRVIGISDDDGASHRVSYDGPGRASTLTDALGRSHQRSGQRAYSSKSGKPSEGVAADMVQQRSDDFGRLVVTMSPDSGRTIRRYDAADRLVGMTDGHGNHATYGYDAAGRLRTQTIVDADAPTPETAPVVTEWQYEGKRLVQHAHPTQSERYRYDERGLMVSTTVVLKRSDRTELHSITRYEYDQSGQITSTSLPDGSVIRLERNGQGQIVALERTNVRTEWLQRLAPSQKIVRDIERDLVGLTGYTAGNGLQTSWQRSKQGVLARVIVRNNVPTAAATTTTLLRDRVLDLLIGINVANAAGLPSNAGASSTQQGAIGLPGALGLPQDPQALLDHRYLWDRRGNLLLDHDTTARALRHSSYAYDSHDRLIVAAQEGGDVTSASRYGYDRAGRRMLSQEDIADQADLQIDTRRAAYEKGSHRWIGNETETVRYDGNGQPVSVGRRQYRWNAVGRLVEVRDEDQVLARYTYNHRGERIGKAGSNGSTSFLYDNRKLLAEVDEAGHLTRQYVYLAGQPIALIDTPQGKPLAESKERSSIAQALDDLGAIVHGWISPGERLLTSP